MNRTTRKLTMLGMLGALAFLAVALIRIPVVQFLKYEPKDVVITIGGFIFGPLEAALLSVVVSLVEMVTISDTGHHRLRDEHSVDLAPLPARRR